MEDNQRLNRKLNNDAGFTFLELLIVILMLGILSSIAAPSWLAFVNRQRVSKVNERVVSVIQEAQRQAKNKKLSYSVSFRINDGVPEAAVYENNDNDNPTQNFQWQSLVGDLGVKPEQIWVGTNLTTENKLGTLSILKDDNKTITFDNQGVLPNDADTNLAIVVAVPDSKDKDNPIEATKRCVIIRTILGALETNRKGAECNHST
ncbi:pilus assembly FimT family protein [Moorena producens]|uniref:pilus assembly FimT family protein n=1 Tax=Moorena producens TaxID=1155739 RepID=UPI003C75B55A